MNLFQKNIRILLPAALSFAVFPAAAEKVAYFPMELSSGKVSEVVGGNSFEVKGNFAPENIPGASGNALRFDGYSTFLDGTLGNIIPAGSKKMTASVWLAIETYPIVEIDVNTPEQVPVVSCIDETARTGFGFFVGFDGKYSFRTFVGGWPLELKVDTPLKQYSWINLTAVIDADARTATLYNNGVPVATSKANGTLAAGGAPLRIGRSFAERFSGPFCLTSFNGLIDDITVWDEALSAETIAAWKPENEADLRVPASRFADDPLRPAFHGMPGANWTNETHGLTYSNGRYHLFFQKNANGPYMSRLHWGHLSSENLFDWREEQIALTPGAPFDIKGCWSGCVFSDDEISKGKPSIIYTGVDYGRAVIAQADPADDDLIAWSKSDAPIIDGRPDGLSDDFRDPYFFRNGSDAYIIVGSSKGGVGTTTLHKYDPSTKRWSNDGKTFFTGTNASSCGTFWEMPNITKIGDKWIFTATPLNTSRGVAILYWIGSLNADGTFTPDRTAPSTVELPGLARDGFGMLSPSVFQKDGKTIALGIVPDKLPSQANHDLGYAHTYSLPREWSIDGDGNLCQKPFAGLAALREKDGFSKENFTLDGSLDLGDVAGRAVELCGEFTVGNGKTGFTLLDDGASSLKVYYNGANNEIVVDARGLSRLINDAGVFDGYYRSSLPRQLAKGEKIKLNLFFDHSVLDIFVNDTWASSVRIFVNKNNSEKVTAFADAPTQVPSLKAWNLDVKNGGSGVSAVADENEVVINVKSGRLEYDNLASAATLSIFNLAGNKVMEKNLEAGSGILDTQLKGIYIVRLSNFEGNYFCKHIF